MNVPRNLSGGQHGEDKAEVYLKNQRYKILHRNWKTDRYEIDIIAKKKRRLYFVEVKYRSTQNQGMGYEYVTPAKLKQMTFAAESWVAQNNFTGAYQLAVISVDGEEITFIADIWQ